MRTPVKSETDAFRIAIGFAVLIAVGVAVGIVVGVVVGVLVVAAGVGVALIYDFVTRDPDRRRPLREAAEEGAQPHEGLRLLVVANETMIGGGLRDEILNRSRGRDVELVVVAPILTTRAQYVSSDFDGKIADARRRLDDTLGWAREQGLRARGQVGDPNPVTAIADELRLHGADEVIVSTHPAKRSNWLEAGLVERLRDELDIPVTHVVVDLERDSAEIER